MSLATVYSRANVGIDAPLVTVEAHISNGLPSFSIVGLPETAVKESKERVRSAILNSQLDFPTRRITINLAPADLPKSGGRFDLAIAVGILAASKQLSIESIENKEFLGELALSGELMPISGILPGIIASMKQGRESIIPTANELEASLVQEAKLQICPHLLSLCAHLKGAERLAKPKLMPPDFSALEMELEEVVGQHHARRALIIAAAGKHNLLMKGPPGTGKTMLANRISSILPLLSQAQAIEVAAIRSISTQYQQQGILGKEFTNWLAPPFRAPHHTSSAVALVGGGKVISTGEISLAHHGVLFLDELPEFGSKALEVLREPMESGSITISRASYRVCLPASFQLIAAMNPCPCGYYGDAEHDCRCPQEKVRQYQQRISGPLLDRIDLHVEVPRLNEKERKQLLDQKHHPKMSSKQIKQGVQRCQLRQLKRAGKLNALLSTTEIKRDCQLQKSDEKMLETAMQRLKLSIRAYFRILKVARTIADFEGDSEIASAHLLEAINYRRLNV